MHNAAAVSVLNRGPRPGFSRSSILDCAKTLLKRQGHEGLSMRSIAAELGISVSALYRYFTNLADLEDELAATLIASVRPLDGSGRQPLRDQLVRLGADFIGLHSQHPYLRAILGPVSAAAHAQLHDRNLRVLLDAGLNPQRAVACYVMILTFADSTGSDIYRIGNSPLFREAAQVMEQKLSPDLMRHAAAALHGRHAAKPYRHVLATTVDAFLPELK